VEVAGFRIQDPRIVFEVERTADETAMQGTIEIYNLKRDNQERIYERGGPIVLSAGYPETVSILLDGNVERVRNRRDGRSRITTIECVGQSIALDRLGGVTMRSYDGLIGAHIIFADIVKDIGLESGDLSYIQNYRVKNFVWSGPSSAALSTLLRYVATGGGEQFRWFDDDGVIRIRSIGDVPTYTPFIVTNKKTGMIDSPTVTDDGVEVSMLLEPRVQIGSSVTIGSETIRGIFTCVRIRHRGDTWSGDFITELLVRSRGGSDE